MTPPWLADPFLPERRIIIDLSRVERLDTLGAWLLEKLSRRAIAAGHGADIVGIADNYAGLINEVRQVNRRTTAPTPASGAT